MDDLQGAELTKKRKEPLPEEEVQAETADLSDEASNSDAAPKKPRLQEAEDRAAPPAKGKVGPPNRATIFSGAMN
jgi:hypothetical protein